MKWAIYNILFLIVYPFLLPGFLVRMLRRGGYAARMGDRFALYPEEVLRAFKHSNISPVWIHAVSVGEVQVAGQLMRAWRKVDPSVRFCFSTTSSTGWMMAQKELEKLGGEGDTLIYNPLDFPTFVRAALLTVRPRAIILTESEIWPNFIRKAKKYGIPLYLINARVSDRSAPRYKKARFFFKDVFRCFTTIFAQSDLDKARLIAAGAEEKAIEVTGSFKFDVAHRNEAKEKELKDWIGPHSGGILLGGSTWPGEDELLLRAYRRILTAQSPNSPTSQHPNTPTPQPILILAPRHFEKADQVEANIRKAGFSCIRRSKHPNPQPSTLNPQPSTSNLKPQTSNFLPQPPNTPTSQPVFLSDTTGELMGLYGISDVVFVGKSISAHGSQNMIEPCLCGKPTFVGPYTENFRPVMSDLLSAEALIQAESAQALEDGIVEAFLHRSEQSWVELGARAKAAVERRCGVVARCVERIRQTLVVLLVLGLFGGCSRSDEETRVRKTCSAVKEAVRGIYRLETAVAVNTPAPKIVPLDVENLTARTFLERLVPYTNRAAFVHLWMPSERSWLLVEHDVSNRVNLAWAMNAVADDPSCTLSVPEIFASYVGTLEDVLPAFSSRLEGTVVPEWFVTKEIPALPWLDTTGVDADILKATLAEIRSMQVVRRIILEGNIASRQVKDKKDEKPVAEKWAKAFLRNPHDSLLLERLDILERNARGFLEVGKVLQAMKCYEMIILVNPKDAVAIRNFGLCLKQVGRNDLAQQVLSRAKELEAQNP